MEHGIVFLENWAYDGIKKIAKDNDVVGGSYLHYPYFHEHYKFIAKNLRKKIKFMILIQTYENDTGTGAFFLLEESKEIISPFSSNSPNVIWFSVDII